MKKKAVWLPYDFDTALGINNEGALVFGYSLEDTDHLEGGADVFNGQESVIWNNLRDAFGSEIKTMYQNLRSTGVLSFDVVAQMFDGHQAKWPEAIFNEDAWVKYILPLIDDGTGAYLSMLQGSKAEQRKWWLYNRFRYLDSKYNAGDALSDVIQFRGYAKANVTVTPYADVYASVKFGSYLQQTRADRNKAYTLICPLDNVNDTEIYIYSASQLADIGDLSGLMVGYADFSMGTKLQAIKLGDSGSEYSNGNLKELYLGNNVLLKTIDVRNCPHLGLGEMKSVDISGCLNIEEAYFDGTRITGIDLPNGGVLRKLRLPATVTNLTILNQKNITELTIPSYAGITSLWLENVSAVVNSKAILNAIPENSRVRVIGFAWEAEDAAEITALFDRLDKMRGLDEYGNNVDDAQVSGTIHTRALTGSQIAEFNARYPYVEVTADHTTSYLYYYTYDGASLLYTEEVLDGGDGGVYTGQPTRPATAANTYTFVGWSRYTNQITKDANALKNVVADRNVYAAYSVQGRTYTVKFYNGATLLQTVNNVPYGGTATYTGATPVSPDGSADEYPFEGWSPSNSNIQGDTSCYAKFGSPLEVAEITDSWDEILAAVANGTYATKYKVGNYKPLDLGAEGTVNMQIIGKNVDALADGSGTVPLTWLSMELLNTSHRMNPSIATEYNEEEKPAWVESEASTWKSNNQGASNSTATANWVLTATDSGTVTISYKVGSEQNCDKLTVKVNGTAVANEISGSINWSDHTVECAAGDTISVTASYSKDSSGDKNGDTAYIKFSSTGALSITPSIEMMKTKVFAHYTERTGAIGGWEKSEMRTYMQDTIKPLIPATVQNAIKTVYKDQPSYEDNGTTNGRSVTQTTQDDVWLPSYNEMFGSRSQTHQPRYKGIFTSNDSRIKSKVGATSASWWWLRSAYYSFSFANVYSSGNYGNYLANDSGGVALGFCT